MKALQFSLLDQDGKTHTLSKYLGKWVILYFYPKDDTPGCTKEACSLEENYTVFTQKNAVILGVSKDSVASHKKFADKFHLRFPLLSDPDAQIIHAYNAWGKKMLYGREHMGILRITYLINPNGEIVKEYKNVNPTMHAQEILTDLTAFQTSMKS